MKFICSLIVVENVEKSRNLFENILGIKVIADFGENVTFNGDFAIHQKDHFSSLIGNREISRKANNFELYFEHNELFEIIESIKAEGLEIIHEIQEQPWKQRVFRFYDYDRNIIEIGESMAFTAFRLSKENYSIDEISKFLYTSVEEVAKAIQEYSNNSYK